MKTKYQKNYTAGFTLIEIMIVISIIGFLSAAILASVGGARKNARDAQIKSLVQQAIPIIEAQFNNLTSAYPSTLDSNDESLKQIDNNIERLLGITSPTDAISALVYGGGTGAFVLTSDLNNKKFYLPKEFHLTRFHICKILCSACMND